jgi:hypothetical protein
MEYSGLILDKSNKFNLFINRAIPTVLENIDFGSSYADLNVGSLNTLSGLVDGVDIIARDGNLSTAETTIAGHTASIDTIESNLSTQTTVMEL